MSAVIPPLLALLVCASFAVGAITRGRWRSKDRFQLLLAGLAAGVLLLGAQRITDWSERWLLGLWWLSVIVLAVGAAAALLRWSALPWSRDGAHTVRRRVVFGVDVLLLVGVVVVLA